MSELRIPLTDEVIESICNSIVNANLPYFPQFAEAFKLLYITGARVEELFEIDRWHLVSGDTYEFLPQKGNYERTVILSSDFESFKSAVSGQFKPFAGLSSGQLNRLFYVVSPYPSYFVDDKPVSLYLFRYAFMRRLYSQGYSLNQIADTMGYTSTQVVAGYLENTIDRVFFYDGDLWLNVNGALWSKNYLNVSCSESDGFVLDIFGDGVPIGFYSRDFIDNYLLSNNDVRLPTDEDFYNLASYASQTWSLDIRAFLRPDYTYFSIVNANMINLDQMNFKGTGVFSGAVHTNFKAVAYFRISSLSSFVNAYAVIRPIFSSPDFLGNNLKSFIPVRLILNV